ncbi:hypothetical protein [Amycolatopsis samaneae]|uniref:Uncharacterized protein n=1 Tax=Amycolatopsis samaneae TaxID=664691 RepID=A0ABW5GQ41_9PSEU
MRWLTLYVRSRRVPTAGAVLLAATLAFWVINVLADPSQRIMFGAFAAVLSASAAAVSLGSDDPDLDRTAAIAWLSRRAAHVLAVGVASGLLLLLTQISDHPLGTVESAIRGVAGMTGLAALGATFFGAQLGWLLPTAQAVVALGAQIGGAKESTLTHVLAWPFQPDGTTAATVTAVVLALAGLLVHAVYGSKRVRTRQ